MSSHSGLGVLSIFFAAACTVCLCDPARPSNDGLPVPKQHDLKVPYALEKLRPCSTRPSGYWHQTLQVICDGWVTRIAQSNDRTFYSLILDRDWKRQRDWAISCWNVTCGHTGRDPFALSDSRLVQERKRRRERRTCSAS